MLRFAEELMLLLLDDERGETPSSLPRHSLKLVLAGAVLMDLALEDRIDTDVERFVFVHATPLGDDLLDPVLADIARDRVERDTAYWIRRIADERGEEIRDTSLARLAARGILEPSESGRRFFLSRRVARTRRYHIIAGDADADIRLRIMRVLFSDTIPDPREVAIITLVDTCGIFQSILSKSELDEAREKIALVRQLDAIGRSVAHAVEQCEAVPVDEPSTLGRIPGDAGMPILGHALDMARDMKTLLMRNYRELGPIFRLRAFRQPLVVLAGPKANEFMARDNKCLRSHEIWDGFDTVLGTRHSPLSADGAPHVRMRRLLAPYLSKRLLADTERFAAAMRIVRRDVAEWPTRTPVAAHDAFQRIVAEQIGFLALGISTRDYVDDIIHLLSVLLRTQVSRQLPRIVTRMPRFRHAQRRVYTLLDGIVEAHAPGRSRAALRPRDLVDDLLEINSADPHFIARSDFYPFMLVPLVAGLDTVASALGLMMYEILKRPDMLERVRAEADDFFAKDSPAIEDLRTLDVTRRVAMETLRLYPITVTLPRAAANSFRFQGHEIRAGEPVLVAHALTHMMPEYYPDPQRFDIDRFTPERAEHKQPRTYLPFGTGPHQCPGRSLAEALLALNTACWAHDAKLALHPRNYKLKTVLRPALVPHKSLRFRVLSHRHTGT